MYEEKSQKDTIIFTTSEDQGMLTSRTKGVDGLTRPRGSAKQAVRAIPTRE